MTVEDPKRTFQQSTLSTQMTLRPQPPTLTLSLLVLPHLIFLRTTSVLVQVVLALDSQRRRHSRHTRPDQPTLTAMVFPTPLRYLSRYCLMCRPVGRAWATRLEPQLPSLFHLVHLHHLPHGLRATTARLQLLSHPRRLSLQNQSLRLRVVRLQLP